MRYRPVLGAVAALAVLLTSCTYSLINGASSAPSAASPAASSLPQSSLPPAQTSTPQVESNEPELPSAPVKPAISAHYEDIASLPSTPVTWGPGTRLNNDGRPADPIALQEKYGKYGAYFIGPDNDKVYLTFDEGYENGYTASILDTLKAKGVSAVFFITYPYAKNCPELVQRMIDEGHIVGNHSTTHPVGGMPTLSLDEIRNDIMKLHDYVLQNYGYEMWLFRPPEGAFSEQTLALTHTLGYLSIMWSFAYKDWDVNNQMGSSAALAAVTKAPHSGGIYLLHAVSKDNSEILGDAIDLIRDKGLTFSSFDLTGENTKRGGTAGASSSDISEEPSAPDAKPEDD